MVKSKSLIVGIVGVVVVAILVVVMLMRDNTQVLSTQEAQTLLSSGEVRNVSVDNDYLYFTHKDDNYKVYLYPIPLEAWGYMFPIKVRQTFFSSEILGEIGVIVVVFLVLSLFFALVRSHRKNKIPQKIQNEPIRESVPLIESSFMPMSSAVRFKDVAGISEVKEELVEIIDYLKNPKHYQDLGITLPKGVLLVGPPGVGKTMIAKAVAGEAGVPFFYQSGSSFVQIYVGMGAKRVRELFARAKAKAPSIIFIDEIDAVGKARGGMRNDEREATLNQLLTEMDGFEDSKGVIVIGATNNMDSMDEALLRSGRFDRRIFVELPNLQERIKILKVHCRDKNYDFNLEEVARLCVGFSGAGIASLINEAALNAIKRDSKIIQKEDILSVRDKVMIGVKKKLSFNEKEKEILAFYQAAKAFSAYHLEIPFEKTTLMSDGLKYLDKEFSSKNELENQIKVHLSGIAALKLLYDEYYSHSKEDLNIAKNIAKKMVESYGMGEYLIGSEEDILRILENCKIERIEFFKNYQNLLNTIQQKLLQNEKLEYQEIGELINATL